MLERESDELDTVYIGYSFEYKMDAIDIPPSLLTLPSEGRAGDDGRGEPEMVKFEHDVILLEVKTGTVCDLSVKSCNETMTI